jgi:hypothetical protein
VRAEFLSLPELREYLHFNSDFPATLLAPFRTHLQYRLALPWTCLVVVWIAAPLGIGYSRRGVLSSVAAAVVLVFTMNFLTHLFLALGEGDRVLSLGGGVDAKPSFRCDRSLSALPARFKSRSARLSSFHCATYSCAMNPLPNEWAIKHRADACAVTRQPFAPGEYFYTLLFHDADGYRREDLSEEAWRDRNENIRPFSFWKSRYEPLPPRPPGTFGEGKCGTALSPFNRIGQSACERVLRSCRHARAQTRLKTSKDRTGGQTAAF